MTILYIWRINIDFQTPKKFFQLPYFLNGHLQLWLEYFVFQCYCVAYIVHDCFLVFPFFEAYLQVVVLLTNVSCFLKPCIMWFTWCHFQILQRTYQKTRLIQKQQFSTSIKIPIFSWWIPLLLTSIPIHWFLN